MMDYFVRNCNHQLTKMSVLRSENLGNVYDCWGEYTWNGKLVYAKRELYNIYLNT